MRTTVRLDDDLFFEVKQHALLTKRSFTELIHDALVAYLAREKNLASPRTIILPTFEGDGLREGVDISSNAALLAALESSEDRTGQ
ncbi:MAG: type II toxin-antitoxin system VapB family antitoxin [Trueperaceae bacterium]|nr:MAG: type II toxin-antitoxin system VapB family antitoxin [Trueperaceae bacterium]